MGCTATVVCAMVVIGLAESAPTTVEVVAWDIAARNAGDDHLPAVTQAMVDKINAGQSSWVAALPKENVTRGFVRRLCGSVLPGSTPRHPGIKPVSQEYIDLKFKQGVPAELDARTYWPNCAPVIGHVRNQGAGCGDCWAYGATQALQDKYCIRTGKNDSVANLLSTEDTLACMDQFIGTVRGNLYISISHCPSAFIVRSCTSSIALSISHT
eukprot:COSAG05_NODE_4337_length_1561_cov_1.307114_1_plen_212_part_00